MTLHDSAHTSAEQTQADHDNMRTNIKPKQKESKYQFPPS
jgi:hypothetical protein